MYELISKNFHRASLKGWKQSQCWFDPLPWSCPVFCLERWKDNICTCDTWPLICIESMTEWELVDLGFTDQRSCHVSPHQANSQHQQNQPSLPLHPTASASSILATDGNHNQDSGPTSVRAGMIIQLSSCRWWEITFQIELHVFMFIWRMCLCYCSNH